MRTTSLSLVVVTALISLTACDKLLHRGAGADAAASAAATSTTPSLADKALSFVMGGIFEGELTVDLTHKGDAAKRTMVYAVKGDKFRMDMPKGDHGGDAGYMLFDNGAKKMFIVSDVRKSAVAVDTTKAKADAANAAKADPPKVTRTGKMDTVAGYECEIWKIEQKEKKTDACMADGLSWFSAGGDSDSWLSDTSGRFPLRVVTSDATGAEVTRMEVTKIEKKTEDAARFEVPAGYQVVDPSAMMGQLGDAQQRIKDAMKGIDAGALKLPDAGAAAATGVDAGARVIPPFPTGTVSITLPPGVKLPAGTKLPPGVTTSAATATTK